MHVSKVRRVVGDKLQDMIDTNFKFYKQEFGKMFFGWLFERFQGRTEEKNSTDS